MYNYIISSLAFPLVIQRFIYGGVLPLDGKMHFPRKELTLVKYGPVSILVLLMDMH